MKPRASLLVLGLLATACGDDDRRPTDRVRSDGSVPADLSGIDAAALDLGSMDAGETGVDAGPPAAQVDLVFGEGCAPSFTGDVAVVRNSDSIAVSATSGGVLTGSVQLALDGASSLERLSTQHRVDTGYVVNVITGTTWTNIAMDSGGVLGGTVADPIDGELRIDAYRPDEGVLDITFTSVILQNPSDGTLCTVEGRLQTFRLSF